MRVRVDEYDWLILSAVCEDLEPLESIAEKTARAPLQVLHEVDSEDLSGRLLRLIEQELIHGYLLHAEPPFMTRVDKVDDSNLSSAWLYITEKGRSYLSAASDMRANEVEPGAVCPIVMPGGRHGDSVGGARAKSA